MPVITAWPTILAVGEGRLVEEATWDPFFDRFVTYGQEPFRGDDVHPGWSPARFDPPRRADENVVSVTALVLDYDDCGTSFDDAIEVWRVFYGFVHTTRKHEPGADRFRVVLPLSREVSPDDYALLWRYAVHIAGHQVDRKTRNPSRFWYVPGALNGGGFRCERLAGVMLDPDPLLVEARAIIDAQRVPDVTRIHASAETRADKYAQAALDDVCAKVEQAGKGSRNNTLFIAASTAGNFIATGNLSEGYAVERLEASARVCGLPLFEARRTIRSGLARGKQSPRAVPESQHAHHQEAATGTHRTAGSVAGRGGAAQSDEPFGAAPEAPKPEEHPLQALWKSIGEWGVLDAPPPPQQWVLMRPDVETNGMGNPIGLLPRSEVGFLIAAGGVGKSFACIQLAISVATGRDWLDYFLVPKTGRVLLLLGEEKLNQAHRRFHDLATCMRLTDQQVQLAKENIVMMPLAGVIAPLVTQDGTNTAETDVMAFLRARMAESEWTLVIIDPLSRFAGADTEKDNVQATRFVQVAETLCKVPGAPTVLFAHHTNKASRGNDAPQPSAADARGASGTTDGGRWCANLMRRKGGASLSFTKNNYGQDYDETLLLERAFGGYLRVQPDEARVRAQELEHEKLSAKARALLDKVREAIKRHPGITKEKLRPLVSARDSEVRQAVNQLVDDGEAFEKPRHHYHLRSASHD